MERRTMDEVSRDYLKIKEEINLYHDDLARELDEISKGKETYSYVNKARAVVDFLRDTEFGGPFYKNLLKLYNEYCEKIKNAKVIKIA